MSKPPPPQSDPKQMVQRAYEQLESAIIFGELKPRQRLVERDLEKQLKVSRTPIREALRRLESAGLVKNAPNRGAFVVDFEPKDIEEIYVVRIALEQLALGLLRPFTKSEIAALQVAQRHIEQAYRSGDYRAMVGSNKEFHRLLLAPMGNTVLQRELDRFMSQTYVVRHFFSLSLWSADEGPAVSMREHKEMIEAAKGEDWEKLRQIMLQHTLRPVRAYLRRLSIESGGGTSPGDALERAVERIVGPGQASAEGDPKIGGRRISAA